MRVAVIGSGHVGLVTGACLAENGHQVICVDNDKKKIDSLKKGGLTFYEPGLPEMVLRNCRKKRLDFSTDTGYAVKFADIIFISVGTPLGKWGGADLSQIRRVSKEIALNLNNRYKIIAEKSTVPVGTAAEIERILKLYAPKNADFDIVSNPEFLQEGSAIKTTLEADRIVIGTQSPKAEAIMRRLYARFRSKILVTDFKSAELIKHASNSFLALKISYINSLANICERSGANIKMVAQGLGMDKRINPYFLNAGIGYGGFCLPKDIAAFIHISEKLGFDFGILKAVQKVNDYQRDLIVRKIKKAIGSNLKKKTIAVWGLAFKPNTDDVRESQAIHIIQKLLLERAYVKAFDPKAIRESSHLLPHVHYAVDMYEAANKCDCLFIATEWDEFKKASLDRLKKIMRRPVIIDGRNIFDPAEMKKLGFEYYSIGR